MTKKKLSVKELSVLLGITPQWVLKKISTGWKPEGWSIKTMKNLKNFHVINVLLDEEGRLAYLENGQLVVLPPDSTRNKKHLRK